MKKLIVMLLALVCVLDLVGCDKKDDVLHLGLNAEITEINAADYSITVKDIDENQSVFGSKCVIDCSNAVQRENILYIDYDGNDSGNVKTIKFADLVVGDKVILNIYDNELNDSTDDRITADSIQLATQRLKFSPKSELVQDDFSNAIPAEVNDSIIQNCTIYSEKLGYETGAMKKAVLLGESWLKFVYCDDDLKQELIDATDIVVIFDNIRCVVDADTEIVLGRIPYV